MIFLAAPFILYPLGRLLYKLTKMSIFSRLATASMALLKSYDILLCTIWLSPLYVINLADKPTGRRMISSYIGKASYNGHRWANILESMINFTFEKLGDKPNHCYRAWRHYQGLDE